jgi:hypothetical protein
VSSQHPKYQIIAPQVAILARRLRLFAMALGLMVALVGAGHLVAWLSGQPTPMHPGQT